MHLNIDKKLLWGSVVTALGATMIVLFAVGVVGPTNLAARLWAAGAMALGFLTGLTTGLSMKEGSGQEFVKFIGTGILVPILGGVGAFLAKKQEVSETSTYDGAQLVQRTTTTVTSFSADALHPFAVLGSFFAGFAVLAVVGIVGGVLLRKGGLEVKAV